MSVMNETHKKKQHRMSPVERARLERSKLRQGSDDRKEPKHPQRDDLSRRSMRALVRWRNKKATGRYGG